MTHTKSRRTVFQNKNIPELNKYARLVYLFRKRGDFVRYSEFLAKQREFLKKQRPFLKKQRPFFQKRPLF